MTEKQRFFWVYLPEIDEAGTVVQASSFEDAFAQGCEMLCPDDGVEVQVHELGESREFRVGEVECDCAGCDTCGAHCKPGCATGDGEACTVEDK